MAEHTKEPWHLYVQRGDGHIAILKGRTEGKVINEGIAFMDAVLIGTKHRAKRKANAERIVACVNACAGIDTEDLEQFSQEVVHQSGLATSSEHEIGVTGVNGKFIGMNRQYD